MKNRTLRLAFVTLLAAGAVGAGIWGWRAYTSGIPQMPRSVLDRWAQMRDTANYRCALAWSPGQPPPTGSRLRVVEHAAAGMIAIASQYRRTYLADDYPYWLSMPGELDTENSNFSCAPRIRTRVLAAVRHSTRKTAPSTSRRAQLLLTSRTAEGRDHLRLRGRPALLRRAGRPASAGAERPFGIAPARSATDLATGVTAKWPPPHSPSPPPPQPARPERVQPPPWARIHAREAATSTVMPRSTASAERFVARLAASPSETNTATRWPRVVKAMR